MRFTRSTATAALAAASLPLALAQTSTSCNPTEKSCPDDTGLSSETFYTDFTQGESALASWSLADYTTLNYGDQGAEFTISKAGQAPTIQTDFYIFFGRVDVKMKASNGQGIVSSVVLESDDLDEIDWEFLGGDPGQVQSDFFGKGNTTAYDRVQNHAVTAATSDFHTYSVEWTSSAITWSIDGSTVRTLSYNDPLTVGGTNYPQTPMRVKLGNWAAGGPGEPEGTVEWAGGKTDFSQAPFTMYVQDISIVNYNPACTYSYGDETGSWESIKLDNSTGCGNNGASGSSSSSISSAASSASSTAVSSAASSSAASSTMSSSSSAQTNGSVATGSTGPTSVASTASQAPTSSHSVANIMPTGAVVSKTVTGSSYSMNTASASAENSGAHQHSSATGTTLTSAVSASTQVPGSMPSGATGVNGTESSGSSTNSAGSSGTSSPAAAGTNAAVLNSAVTAVSLLSIVAGLFML